MYDAVFVQQEAMMKDIVERTREPNLDLKGYLLNAYINPVFKEVEEDLDDGSVFDEEELETVLVPTKRSSRINTPMPSKHTSGLSSTSLPEVVVHEQKL